MKPATRGEAVSMTLGTPNDAAPAPAREDGRLRRDLFQGLLPIGKGRVGPEVIAGITLAALAMPEVMGYTKIAGMPVVTGLYTILLPITLFALLGSSRHLVVGADSATAAIMFAALAPLAAVASPSLARKRRRI